MGYISVKLPNKAKPLLHQLKLRMMKQRGNYVPDGEAVYEALKAAKSEGESTEKGSWEAISPFIGSLKISDEEAEEWIKRIHEERKKWRSM